MRRIIQTIRQILIIPALLSIYLALAIIEHRERRRGRKWGNPPNTTSSDGMSADTRWLKSAGSCRNAPPTR